MTPSLLSLAGVSLNPIIVYCPNQKEMDLWFGLLKENIEANGGTAIAPENYTRLRVSSIICSFHSRDVCLLCMLLCCRKLLSQEPTARDHL